METCKMVNTYYILDIVSEVGCVLGYEKFVKAEMVVEVNGYAKEMSRMFYKEEWEGIKKYGYFLEMSR